MVVKSKIPVAEKPKRAVISTDFLSDVQKYLLVKMLAEKSAYEVGIEFGFDKRYKTVESIRSAVHGIYRQVENNPDRFGASVEVLQKVQEAKEKRLKESQMKPAGVTLREKQEALENIDIKELTLSNRQKAGKLLSRKLDRIGSSAKRLDEVNISSLAQVFGIIFDKAQIISGEATENIAVMAKIDENLNPQQALDMVLKMREHNLEDKDRKKK